MLLANHHDSRLDFILFYWVECYWQIIMSQGFILFYFIGLNVIGKSSSDIIQASH
jgi:hypothetical protein